jgi:DNA-binding Lrp family transcriptional regulator
MPESEQAFIDVYDEKILGVLLDNAKASFREIAKKTGLSVATALNRVRRLEKEGIIKGYSAVIDYEKLGYDVPVMIQLRVSKGKLFEVEQLIAKHPNVTTVYDHTGASDALIVARFRNRRSMDAFIKKIQSYEFVERTETQLILNTIKEEPIRP